MNRSSSRGTERRTSKSRPATPVAAKVASPARAQQTRQSSSPFDDMARDDKNKYPHRLDGTVLGAEERDV